MVWDPTYAFGVGSQDWAQFEETFQRHGRATFLPGRGDLEGKFARFCEYALQQSNAMVFIDEPAMVGNSRSLPQSFHDLHRLGHKRGLGVTIASHSVWDLPNVCQTFDHLFCFRVSRIIDVNALKQLVPEQGVAWIQKAPNYHFWYQSRTWSGPNAPISVGKPAPVQGSSEKPSA